MSEETIIKMKMATISSIGVAVLSLVVTILLFWTGGISKDVATHSTDIATLKQCMLQMVDTDKQMKDTLDKLIQLISDIRIDQAKHCGVSSDNNKKMKTKYEY